MPIKSLLCFGFKCWQPKYFFMQADCTRRWSLGLFAVLLVWPVQVLNDARTFIPQTSSTALAHTMADFNNHMELFDNIGSWVIEDESNNYTSWRYSVRYECGSQCSGRALVMLHEELPEGGRDGLKHGHFAQLLKLYIAHEQCHSILLLPWPRFCGLPDAFVAVDTMTICSGCNAEDWVVRAEVRGVGSGAGSNADGGGAQYVEQATRRCWLGAAMYGTCGAELRRHQARRITKLPMLAESLY